MTEDKPGPDERNSYASTFKLLVLVGAGMLAALYLPAPQHVETREWHTLILFAGTLLGVLWQPYPLPVIVLIALALGGSLSILSPEDVFRGFSSSVVWIMVSAFVFARAYVKTGLGRRLALLLISRFGKSSLRLGYSLAFTDLLLAPVTASNTARAGGVIYPVARSLAVELGSEPGPTARRIGAYLLFTAFQANVVTSAMFLTATAVNGLTVELAENTARVHITWRLWFLAASLPGILSLLTIPYVIYRTYTPELKETLPAQTYARQELARMGPLNREEKWLGAIFLALAITWAMSTRHSVSVESAALLAVCSLIVSGVLGLDDLLAEKTAWSTFIWVGGVLSLAGPLAKGQLVGRVAQSLQGLFPADHGAAVLILLGLLYFVLHYAFVSITAQILTLYVAFLAAALAAGAQPLMASLLFCFLSSLYAATTFYGSGPAPVFFGAGYIDRVAWLKTGIYVALVDLLIWIGPGFLWWHILGIW
jgi:DASS family divalent anion:Na+ symporter